MNFYNFISRLLTVFLLSLYCANAISEISEYSIINLITISSLDDIAKEWAYLGDTIYDEGRIILTPKPTSIQSTNEAGFQFGSIWSQLSKSLNAFTLEFTFRSMGNHGLTDAGISIFLIDGSSTDFQHTENFGGPSNFKGLQLLLNVDNNLKSVIRPYLNDGSKSIDIENEYLGAYKYDYQGSQVPTTFKIAYESKFLKITCDNKLLFQTDEIKLDTLIASNNLKFGITAKSSKNLKLHEQFEILKLNTYDSVTDEMKLDNDETLFAMHAQKEEMKTTSTDNAPSAKFIQQQQKLRAKLSSKPDASSSDFNIELELIKSTLDSILSNIQESPYSSVQTQLATIITHFETLTSNYNNLEKQFNTLNNNYKQLSDMFEKQFKLLDNYETSLRSFDKVLQNQLKISDNLDNKLSTLTSHYSNTLNEYANSNSKENSSRHDSFSSLKSVIYIIFFLLLALLILVALWIHKLRNDIKHAKIL